MDEFFTECEEILQRVSANLQSIEGGASGSELMDGLYRDMHTLKGTAFLFGFNQIGTLAHALEASLEPMRRLSFKASPELIDICFRCLDLIDRLVKAIRAGQGEAEFAPEVSSWIPRIIEAASAQFGGELAPGKDTLLDFFEGIAPAKPAVAPVKAAAESAEVRLELVAPPAEAVAPPPSTKSEPKKAPAPAAPQAAAPAAAPGKTENAKAAGPAGKSEAKPAPRAEPKPAEEEHKVEQKTEARVETKAEASPVAAASLADGTVRVQVALLDRLMNLVGELVLVRNQVLQLANSKEEQEMLNLSKSLDVVTSELQSEVMRTRMQPIGNILNKFQRVVRDLSRDLQKSMDITLQGTETELDKTMIEAIKDPLTHIIRNSCDHGVEDPEERKRTGKPENGHILVRAFHESGQVVVEVSDDGKGLDRQKLVAKALEKGLITQEKAAKMPEREAFNLIFLPGFSTAKQVTSVSGRGVGMDVVKTNIEKIGGSVEISSVLGRGTTTRLRIPLTLAIVPAMLVRCHSGQRFAIPQVKLVELVRIDGADGGPKVEILQGRPVFRLRGELLPLVDLHEALGFKSEKRDISYSDGANVVVLNAEGQIFGLIVKEILDTADIVVKPLSSFLNGLSIFSGATVMGDGSVALILDVSGLAASSRIDTKKGRTEDSFVEAAGSRKSRNADVQEFLLFQLSSEAPHAIPLCLVHRLEEFPVSSLERSGERWVVRYRDAILPLIFLDSFLGYPAPGPQFYGKERISVVVIQRTGRAFGLVVKDIQDIVCIEEQIDDMVRDRPGLLGNVIQQDQVIVIVDALGVVEAEVGRFSGAAPAKGGTAAPNSSALETLREQNRRYKNKKVRVLFAEDVGFFRKQVAKLLTQQGFEVTTAENGAEALSIMESGATDQFNLILSDIEMPVMNGLDFAREVRKRERFNGIPMIALTTKFRQSDIDAGRAAGFSLYLEKLNADKLLSGIESVFSS